VVEAIRICIGAGYVRCQVKIVQGCCVVVLLPDKLASNRVHMQIVTGQCPEVAGVAVSFQPLGLGYRGRPFSCYRRIYNN
jgi:hypothetical protein